MLITRAMGRDYHETPATLAEIMRSGDDVDGPVRSGTGDLPCSHQANDRKIVKSRMR
jgi:hypothetical protein